MLSKKTVGARCACVVGGMLLLWGCGLAEPDDGTLTGDRIDLTELTNRPPGFEDNAPTSYRATDAPKTADLGPEQTILMLVEEDFQSPVTIGFTARCYANGQPALPKSTFRIWLQERNAIVELGLRLKPGSVGRIQAYCAAHAAQLGDLPQIPDGWSMNSRPEGTPRRYKAARLNSQRRSEMEESNLHSRATLLAFVESHLDEDINLNARAKTGRKWGSEMASRWYRLWSATTQALNHASKRAPRRKNSPATCAYRDPQSDQEPNWIDLTLGETPTDSAKRLTKLWDEYAQGAS